MQIRVLCIDDHSLILAGVQAMLSAETDMQFVGGARTALEGVELFKTLNPDVTLVDLRLPGVPGTAAISRIRATRPSACIIALTTYKGDEDIHRALTAGAQSYLLKDALHRELIESIRKVHKGGRSISPEAALTLAENCPRVALTGRELEVLQLMADGNRNKEIAYALKISEDTIKFHVKSILSKLAVNDRTHAVTVAIKRGILQLD
ncbi:MAG TPA: response regulator transcription factor [Acidisarcina sp.]